MNKREYVVTGTISDELENILGVHLSSMNKPYSEQWAKTFLDLVVVKNGSFPENRQVEEVIQDFINATYYDTDIQVANSTPLAHLKSFNEFRRKHYSDKQSVTSATPDLKPLDFDLTTAEGLCIEHEHTFEDGAFKEDLRFSVTDYLIGCESLYANAIKEKKFLERYPEQAEAYKACKAIYEYNTSDKWVPFANTKTKFINAKKAFV